MGSKSYRQVGRSVSVQKISRCILPLRMHFCLALLLAIAVMIRSSRSCSKTPFTGFTQLAHPSRCSRSTLATVYFCARVSVFTSGPCVYIGAAALHQIHHRLVTVVLLWSVGSMVNRTILQNLQCCCSTEAETGFVPTSAQFFAVGTFLILKSPSWTRSCIQKYPVSMCFVCFPAPNRSVKEFAVELSLCISIFIEIPRPWYIDLRDCPT